MMINTIATHMCRYIKEILVIITFIIFFSSCSGRAAQYYAIEYEMNTSPKGKFVVNRFICNGSILLYVFHTQQTDIYNGLNGGDVDYRIVRKKDDIDYIEFCMPNNDIPYVVYKGDAHLGYTELDKEQFDNYQSHYRKKHNDKSSKSSPSKTQPKGNDH